MTASRSFRFSVRGFAPLAPLAPQATRLAGARAVGGIAAQLLSRAAGVVVTLTLLAAACGGGSPTAAGPAPSATVPADSAVTTSTPPPPAPPVAPATTSAPATTASPAPVAATVPAGPAPSDPRIQPATAEVLHASWRPGCPVAPEELRLVAITHLGFDGADHAGTLVVRADVAQAVLDVFDQLRALGYPIERIEPVDAYGGSDDASMAVNNTSAFNCRPVTGGTGWSRHAYGTAIDLNPRQNPYVTGDGQVLPPEGAAYVDRSPAPGVIRRGDGVVEAFAAIGWRWGGDWSDPVDYQHFDRRP